MLLMACTGWMPHVIHRLLRKLVHMRMGQVKYHGLKGIKVLEGGDDRTRGVGTYCLHSKL